MKRSEINSILRMAKKFMFDMKFHLPPWAYWDLNDWKRNRGYTHDIIENMLGWDITDFGSGNFSSRGLFLFTLRNGKLGVNKKTYAEKIMIVEEDQETPMHYHISKMEDIINRGGGNLVIELYNSSGMDFDTTKISLKIDGITREISPGCCVVLSPGESICLEPGVYHRFYGQKGKGMILVGEVSSVNDDKKDNCFYEDLGRFPMIEADEVPEHLLVSDYESFLGI